MSTVAARLTRSSPMFFLKMGCAPGVSPGETKRRLFPYTFFITTKETST